MTSYRVVRLVLALVIPLVGINPSRAATDVDVPVGPDTYGYTVAWMPGFVGYGQDAQSFVATGSRLGTVSIELRAQPGDALQWKFQLWDDLAGAPNVVIAEFGSFIPDQSFRPFTVQLNGGVAIQPGGRYYLGLAPVVPLFGEGFGGILVRGHRETTASDAYPSGTVWAIRNPGSADERLRAPNGFDFSMFVSTVPEVSSFALLLVGLPFVMPAIRRRT